MGSEFIKYKNLPGQDVLSGRKPQLPRYVTSPTVARSMGFSEEAVRTLRPDTTHIAYPQTPRETFQQRQKFEAAGPNRTFIPPYQEGKYRVVGQPNPAGSGPLMQVHPEQNPKPKERSTWHTTKEVFRTILWSGGADPRSAFQKALELPRAPSFSSVAEPKSYKPDYLAAPEATGIVEISFNGKAHEQIRFKPNTRTRYRDTKPL